MSDYPKDIITTATIDELLSNEKFSEITAYINHLINIDFPQLMQLLYRLDISEEKLKQILKEKPDENAGTIIATLIIDRQIKKLHTRMHQKDRPDHDLNEKW